MALITREDQLRVEMLGRSDEGPVTARIGDFTTKFPENEHGPLGDAFTWTRARVYFLEGDDFGEWFSSVPRNPPMKTE